MTRFAILSVLFIVVIGCQQAEDPALLAQRAKFTLSEEPSGAMGVLEARMAVDSRSQAEATESRSPTQLKGNAAALQPDEPAADVEEETPDAEPLIILGRVGTNAEQTWEPGKAEFVIMDPTAELPDHDHSEGHDPDNCPFCKAKQGNAPDPTALVRVVDQQGNVVSQDARKLFGLTAGQLVVVRGRAKVDSIGNLVVTADGIYPRE